jgi:2,3-bisphosphoglycerate-independent phosphoglycerate mutase
MTQYAPTFSVPVISPPQKLDNILAEWLSSRGISQCHIAETEKYAHVTFFFNGGQERAFPGESRVLVPSPKVATYDMKPEMSVMEVADNVCKAIESREFGFVLCNLAPPDMVGHTGKYLETVKAVEATGISVHYFHRPRRGKDTGDVQQK